MAHNEVPAIIRRVKPLHIDTTSDLAPAFEECGAGALARAIVEISQELGWWKPFDHDEIEAAFLAYKPDGTDDELVYCLQCLERHELVRRTDDGKFNVTDEFIRRCFRFAPAHQVDFGV